MDEGVLEMIDPILITGCARSGTSMVAGCIHLAGAFTGLTSGPNKNNKKGMFENARIRNEIVKPYLRSIDCDPLGQYPLPNIDSLPIPNNWRWKVETVMEEDGYQGGPWLYKGAKMCLMWPVWKYAFPNAKWIIVRRRTEDIINSCKRTSFMRAYAKKAIQNIIKVDNEDEGWAFWIHEHEKRFQEMINAGLNCRMIWPETFVRGDYTQLVETIEWLGLKWNSEILNFIDPKLYKSRKKGK